MVVLMLIHLVSFAQKKQGRALADSLVAAAATQHDDTARVKLLKKAADLYSKINVDTGLQLGDKALAVARSAKWEKGIAMANMALAVNYEERADYPGAMAHYLEALKVNEGIGNKRGVALANWGLANIYRSQHRLTTSNEYDQKALAYFKATGDETSVAQLLLNIGNNFYLLNKDDTALDYFARALAISQQRHDDVGAITPLLNMGSVYMKKGQNNRALDMYFRCADEMRVSGETADYGSVYGNIGVCYVAIAKDTNGISPGGHVPAGKAANLHLAVQYLDSALQFSRSVGSLDDQRITLGDMADAYEAAGDYRNALACHRGYADLKDSIYSVDNTAELAKLENQRAMDVKQKDIEIARLRSNIYKMWIVLLATALLVVAIVVLRQLRSNKVLSVEKIRHVRRLRSQSKILEHIAHIQSHDLRGAVSTILGLSQLFNTNDPADPGNKEVIEGINEVAVKLDAIVTEVINEENKLMKDNADER